jgi:hypothetical protein
MVYFLGGTTVIGLREFLDILTRYFAALSEDLEPSIGRSTFI